MPINAVPPEVQEAAKHLHSLVANLKLSEPAHVELRCQLENALSEFICGVNEWDTLDDIPDDQMVSLTETSADARGIHLL